MTTRTASLGAAVLIAATGLLAPIASAATGTGCPSLCASADDCIGGATCFDGACVFYSGSGGSTGAGGVSGSAPFGIGGGSSCTMD